MSVNTGDKAFSILTQNEIFGVVFKSSDNERSTCDISVRDFPGGKKSLDFIFSYAVPT